MSDLSSPNDHVADRLRNDPIAWLGSVRPDGRPHLVPVWFHWDGETIFIFSKPDQKVRNLRQNPRVTLALDDSQGGGDVALLDGTAVLLDEPTATIAPPAFIEKYADRMDQMGTTMEIMAAEYSQSIRITPTRFLSW
jgi:PPOX class probable F420-dependent enzyme